MVKTGKEINKMSEETMHKREITQLLTMVANLRQRTTHLEAISISERGHIRLSKDDIRIVLKVLTEWEEVMEANDSFYDRSFMGSSTHNTNWQRYNNLKARMENLMLDPDQPYVAR